MESNTLAPYGHVVRDCIFIMNSPKNRSFQTCLNPHSEFFIIYTCISCDKHRKHNPSEEQKNVDRYKRKGTGIFHELSQDFLSQYHFRENNDKQMLSCHHPRITQIFAD